MPFRLWVARADGQKPRRDGRRGGWKEIEISALSAAVSRNSRALCAKIAYEQRVIWIARGV
jgi:hypothetical protein